MWKAFGELEALGWIGSKRPRLVSVQAVGCAPIVKAIQDGAAECTPWSPTETAVPGVKVAKAFADWLILKAIRSTGGTAVGVDDASTLEMQARLAREEGIFLSPESAMTVAAAAQLREAGVVRSGKTVVAFNTASGLRYPHLIQETPRLFHVDEEIVWEGRLV